MRTRRTAAPTLLLSVALALTLAPPARAQERWRLVVETGANRFRGAAADTSTGGDEVSLRPAGQFAATVRAEVPLAGRFGVALAVSYARSGSAVADETVIIVDREFPLRLIELAPALTVRLASTETGARLRLHAGPLLDLWRWSLSSTPARTRVGVRADLVLDVPVTGRMGVAMRVGGAVSGSPYTTEELPPEFERRQLWRTNFGVGIRWEP